MPPAPSPSPRRLKRERVRSLLVPHPHPRPKRDRVGFFFATGTLPRTDTLANSTLTTARSIECAVFSKFFFFMPHSYWLTTLLSPPTPSLATNPLEGSPHAAPPPPATNPLEGSPDAAPTPRSKRAGILLYTVNRLCVVVTSI
jgi:hypothetical protein